MKNRIFWGLFVVFFFFSSNTLAEGQLDYDQLVEQRKSKDPRPTQKITLENGLEVTLIQDVKNNNAFASMNVGVGSLAEHKDQRGLAHFLEHLLFLGSEKYPDVDAYKKYLGDNGGSSNAFTSRTDTNYFFSVSGVAFEGALDRFAQFFISPLLDPRYVTREKDAIQKEYLRILENDGWRGFRAQTLAMNPEHPYSWYFPGSLDSLQSVERKDALEFYQKHYSSTNMKLALIGPQSLETLEKWARTSFSNIKNTGATEFKVPDHVFKKESLPKRISVQSFSPTNSMSISFILPYDKDYKSKSLQFISSVVGSEVAGSLTSYLKDLGLIFSLSSSGGDQENFNVLSVNLRLTQKGVEQKDFIIQEVFSYLDLIRREGIPDYRISKQTELFAKNFLEAPYLSSDDYAVQITRGMKELPNEDYFARSSLVEEADLKKISDLLEQLKPENLLIVESSPNVSGPLYDKDYELFYSLESLVESELVTALKSERPIPSGMILPQENPYFLEVNPFLTTLKETEIKPLKSKASFNSSIMEDREFDVPKTQVTVKLNSAQIGLNPLQWAIRILALRTLTEFVNEIKYEGNEADYNFLANIHTGGLTLNFTGPTNRLPLFIEQMIKRISQPMNNEVFLTLAKESINEEIMALATRDSLDAAFSVLSLNMYEDMGLDEIAPFISQIDLNSINQEINQLLYQSFVELIIIGNTDKKLTETISQLIEKQWVSQTSLLTLPNPAPFVLPKNSLNQPLISVEKVKSENFGFLYNFTLSDLNDNEVGALDILSTFIGQEYFTTMRTEKGLAYAVGGSSLTVKNGGLIYLYIQSDSAVNKLYDETLAWMPKLISKLKVISPESFESMRAGLLTQLENPPQSHNQKWSLAYDNWEKKAPRLKRAEKIELIKKAKISDLMTLIEKIEKNYATQSLSIGVWPEEAPLNLPEGVIKVDRRFKPL